MRHIACLSTHSHQSEGENRTETLLYKRKRENKTREKTKREGTKEDLLNEILHYIFFHSKDENFKMSYMMKSFAIHTVHTVIAIPEIPRFEWKWTSMKSNYPSCT